MQQGIKLIVYEKGTFPDVSADGIEIGVGLSASVAIKVTKVKPTYILNKSS